MALKPHPITWLWALILGLSALKAASDLWLPPGSPLRGRLCPLMQGLPSCRER